jgi:hypothetical protein
MTVLPGPVPTRTVTVLPGPVPGRTRPTGQDVELINRLLGWPGDETTRMRS